MEYELASPFSLFRSLELGDSMRSRSLRVMSLVVAFLVALAVVAVPQSRAESPGVNNGDFESATLDPWIDTSADDASARIESVEQLPARVRSRCTRQQRVLPAPNRSSRSHRASHTRSRLRSRRRRARMAIWAFAGSMVDGPRSRMEGPTPTRPTTS